MSFSENVKKYRSARGLTQEELGAKTGVSGQAVSKWETADSYPDPSLLPALADALDVTIDELFGRDTRTPARLIEDVKAYLAGIPDSLPEKPADSRLAENRRAEKSRRLFEILSEAFIACVRLDANAVDLRGRSGQEGYYLDLGELMGLCFPGEELPMVSVAMKPAEGWESLFRDEKTAAFLDAMGDPDVRKCLLWLLGRGDCHIEETLIPKRAGADVSRTKEILDALYRAELLSFDDLSVNGTPRRIASTERLMSWYSKGPLLNLLAAAWACANSPRGTNTWVSVSEPPVPENP